MKFIKYKQVARITLYGFDDLLRGSSSAIYTEPVNSEIFQLNLENGKQIGKDHKNARSARRSRDRADDEVGGYRHNVKWVPDPNNPSLTKSADMDREREARKKRYATELP